MTVVERESTPVGAGDRRVQVLRSAGVSLVLASAADGLPEVLHWGRDVGPVAPDDTADLLLALGRPLGPSALDARWPLTVLPTERDGWEGRPGIAGHVDGMPLVPRWRDVATAVVSVADGQRIVVTAESDSVALRSEFALDTAGVLRVRHTVTNTHAEPVHVQALEATLPVGERITEVLDLGGRWTRERAPQHRAATAGSHARESRRGRTGHDSPTLLVLGTPGFSDAEGELWAVHLAWSADSVYRYDQLAEARPLLGAGELLRAGEVVLGEGESFTAPDAVFVWSDTGIDGLSDRLHDSLRSRPGHPRRPRPVVLNTWEAVYYRQELEPLVALAETAADIGVERFVLDDGWFLGRRSDSTSLGDWSVDPTVWPDGLAPLVDRVRALGMEFGLWFEPEMVSPVSELAEAHPEWMLQRPEDDVRTWRNQYVLDMANPLARHHVLESMSRVIGAHHVDFVKWDQNRDIVHAVHAGRAGIDAHTRGVYALMDELRARHPWLEIEACASGGARIDLGVLERTDRVWPSDSNDAFERLPIQRWTEALLPLELIGSHVGPEVSHTTGRHLDLDFRMAVSLFGSAGIETDITKLSPEELDRLRAWTALYRRERGLLHSGRLRHLDLGDPGTVATSVVATDRSRALVRVARTETGPRSLPVPLRVRGLDRSRRYRLAPVAGLAVPHGLDMVPPEWLVRGHLELTGAVFEDVGARLPLLAPATAIVLELRALD
ncbi:alpha-galactosidase [Curtobacterium flaccumfaciens]|uniref:alpha-galactosidase n=1 Tax=Curtobacterium flaccumfaciens TaxID=2035 RepID=UPI0021FC0254|nr:alpha-galactosidase [Curtobacterium flaccumfaciens]UWD80458.1 alpha-galactosidase [Curtobacterium flaccumfaciens]